MKILLPPEIVRRIRDALVKAGQDEIGGIMMGEHVGDATFRVVEVTVQDRGTVARFVRGIRDALWALDRFFHRTNRNYRRFNYLGEWHSHPLFSLHPSGSDQRSMREIVDDPKTAANFAVLMLTKLRTGDEAIEASARVFQRGRRDLFEAELIFEEEAR